MSVPVWQGLHRLLFLLPTATQYYDDYVYVKYPDHPRVKANGRVLLHRVIMENHIGRYLTAKEVVHHRDLNKSNNAIDNLELCRDHADHQRKHRDQGTLGFDRRVVWPPDEEMFTLLDQISIGATARKLKVDRSSVVVWCRRHGFVAKPGRYWQLKFAEELRPPKEDLARLVQVTPLNAVAVQYDVTTYVVRGWCEQLDISYPGLGQWRKKDLPDREEFRCLVEQSVACATRHYSVNKKTIKRWAERLGFCWADLTTARKSHIDEVQFRAYCARLAAHEITVAEVIKRLGITRKIFEVTCRTLGLHAPLGGWGVPGVNITFSIKELTQAAALVNAGKLTRAAAAARLATTDATFKKYCAIHKIELSPWSKRPPPPYAELVAHAESGASHDRLVRMYHTSGRTVTRWLRDYNISVKKNTKYTAKPPPPREELAAMLWSHTRKELMSKLGVSYPTIKAWIRKYDITDLPPKGYWNRKDVQQRSTK